MFNVPKSSRMVCRAYPGSDFVVANTLAKCKKLEPNEINFSHGFSQKEVSTCCFVFTWLAGNLLPADNFIISLDTDQARQIKTSGLIWI